LQTFIVAFLLSFLTVMLTVRLQRRHRHLTGDPSGGVHKFHEGLVPRIGGLGVAAGLVAAQAWSAWRGLLPAAAVWLLLAALPAYAAGLAEDLTKQLGPRVRLIATLLSAALGVWWLGAALPRLDIPGVDAALAAWPALAVLFTVVAVAGMSNAINIIDGFNGLAAAVGTLASAALGYVAWALGDLWLLQVCLALGGALLGFFVWNYPRGLIFLGDGGAYLVGFLLAEVAVLLVVRHEEVSPWFGLLVCLYPVTETLFSIYRKWVWRRASPLVPDALHLHMLVYRRLVRWAAGHEAARDLAARNAATSPYLWGLASLAMVPAVLFWQHPRLLQASALAFVVVYVVVYVRLVRFRVPHWMRRRI
jgi:UDP-N-acetylmuramyl pentapeptide phosphotransferase/UDP-N-acetylglucosamine-1-phosphate transferase